ncbi:MAG: hypothetical protein A3I01_01220 [Betaproteobacteria bacterium RIFCSPLOWO2_02_FULL_65_24]|nr:MAG: hypothetical protein A3I01_01220 [Betaproteobacteria bacterium RIFCSPLOWO2_02_FULL_65_24]OGA34720.1 MAG: hypothetical protein A3G80_03505 [Betaproteobacteria bacterium RIFCSPLOWO2_12_FULL_62_13b]
MLQAPCPRFVDLVLLGDLEGGLALLDDTMAVAMGGELSAPWAIVASTEHSCASRTGAAQFRVTAGKARRHAFR